MMKETLRHLEAFDYYYSLGEERSLMAAARQFGVSERTINRWNTAFNWQQRILERDAEIAKKLEEKTNKAIVNEKAKYRKIIEASIAKYVAALRNGQVKVESVTDLRELIKLDLLLTGEPTDRNEMEIEVKLVE